MIAPQNLTSARPISRLQRVKTGRAQNEHKISA